MGLSCVVCFFLMCWGDSLESNQVYSLVIVTRNSKLVHSDKKVQIPSGVRADEETVFIYIYIYIYIYS